MSLHHKIEIDGDSELTLAFAERMVKKGTPRDPVAEFEKILRRSLAKTGSETFKLVKSFWRYSKYTLEPQRVHPKTGLAMAQMFRKYRPADLARGLKPRKITKTGRVGGQFYRMMQWQLDEEDGKWVKVGLIPERRGGKEWAKKFDDWQQAGKLDFSGYNKGANFFAMQTYAQVLGMPISRWPQRPKRDVIGQIDRVHQPSEMFEKFFKERVQK